MMCPFQYREYPLQLGRDGNMLKIELVDTMGFMATDGGILNEDVTTILDGKAPNTAAVSLN